MEKRTQSQGEILDGVAVDINVPWLYRWTKISHYYGDSVRELLIAAAILMLVSAPFYADDLNTELPVIILGAVVAVCVAALTSPWKRGFIGADAVVAGVGLVLFQIWALKGYQPDLAYQFVLREAIAMIFLFALYFSTKTLRSMLLNQIGRPDSLKDFVMDKAKVPPKQIRDEDVDWNEQALKALRELNEHEKMDFND